MRIILVRSTQGSPHCVLTTLLGAGFWSEELALRKDCQHQGSRGRQAMLALFKGQSKISTCTGKMSTWYNEDLDRQTDLGLNLDSVL